MKNRPSMLCNLAQKHFADLAKEHEISPEKFETLCSEVYAVINKQSDADAVRVLFGVLAGYLREGQWQAEKEA